MIAVPAPTTIACESARSSCASARAASEVIQREVLPRFLRYDGSSEGFGHWAAIEKATGRFVGWFDFHPPEVALLKQQKDKISAESLMAVEKIADLVDKAESLEKTDPKGARTAASRPAHCPRGAG